MHKDNTMPWRVLKSYMMHKKHASYQNHIREAQKNIKTILNDPELKPVVEFSGGKDSIVLLHLVMEQDNTIPVYNYHPGYAKYTKQLFRSQKTHNEIIKSAKTCGATDTNLAVVNTPFYNGKDYLIGDYFDMLFDYMDSLDLNLELLGIRGQESCTRKERVKGDLIRVEDDRVLSFPIRHLTTDDVWTYILDNDIYYVSHYDKYGKMNGYDNVRFTSHFNTNELSVGGGFYFDSILYPSEEHITPKIGDVWKNEINKGE